MEEDDSHISPLCSDNRWSEEASSLSPWNRRSPALLELQVKAANSADLSGSTGFTRKIQKYFVSKENSDQKGTSSPKGLENNMNEISSTNNDEIIRGLLSVNVYSAKDLTPTVIKRKSDPFVVLTMKKTGTKLRTRVVKDDLNPVWNQTFDFIVEDGLQDMLVVEVYDHATSRKGCMGRCKFTLTRIISERKYEDWFPLDEAKSGKLHLFLNWMAQPIYCDS